MKPLLFRVFLLILTFPIFMAGAQAPPFVWQKCLGSPYLDYAWGIEPTKDSGSIVNGYVSGAGGDVYGWFGLTDYWLAKQDKMGAIQWSVNLGGFSSDEGTAVRQTPDGGYIVAGESASPQGNGNVTSPNKGGLDYWVVKLNSAGGVVWQKSFGGSKNEYCYDIRLTADGGYILAGETESTDGDVTGNHGGRDFWVVKLNSDGSQAWQRCIGGSSDDEAYSVRVASDGYVVTGYSTSSDGNSIGFHGKTDMLAAKLDLAGNLVWSKCLGGTAPDVGWGVEVASDGSGYFFAGTTGSTDGDVSGKHNPAYSTEDAWVIKLDKSGNVLWQRCYGGSNNEVAFSIAGTADGGYVLAGSSNSNDGDVTCMPAGITAGLAGWVFKIDGSGNLVWEKVISGGYLDEEHDIRPTADGGFVISGYTCISSIPGYHHDATNTVGDYYVGKLSPQLSLSIAAPPANVCSGTAVTLTTNFAGPSTGVTYHWFKNGVDQGVNATTYNSTGFTNGDIVYCEVLVSGAASCGVDQTVTSNSVQLSVSPVAAPAIGIGATGATTVCAGSTVSFNSTVTGGSAGGTYQWLVNGSPAAGSGSVPAFSSAAFADGDVVSCVYSDNAVCVVPGQIISNAVTVHVNPTVGVTVSIAADSLNKCAGRTFDFAATFAGGGSSPVFEWLVNGTMAGGAGGSGPTLSGVALADGDQVSCKLSSSAACATPEPAVSNTLSITVRPVLQSSIRVGFMPTVLCSGQPVVFNAGASNAGTAPGFQWAVNGSPVGAADGGGSGASDSSVYVTSALVSGDVVSCTVSDAGQCVIPGSDAVTVTVNPSPGVGKVAPVLLSKGQSVSLDLPVIGTITSYAWSPGTWLSDSTVAEPVATPMQTTDYRLTVTTSAGCSDTGSLLIKIFSHVSIPGAFTPNGDGHNDIFYVVGGPIGGKVADFAVYDRFGQAVFAVHGVPPDDPSYGWNGTIGGRAAPAGTYVYALRLVLSDGSQQVFKGTVVLVR